MIINYDNKLLSYAHIYCVIILMHKLQFITSIISIILLSSVISPANSFADKYYRVVLFSDRLTSGNKIQEQGGFSDRLEKKLRATGYNRIEVINLGKENYLTSSALSDTELVERENPDVVIIQLGFNDSALGVPSATIGYNLGIIINDIKKTGAYIILIGAESPANMGNKYRHEVDLQYHAIASAHKISLYPNALEGLADNQALTLADGRQLNAAGIETLVTNILPMVDAGLRWRYELYMETVERENNNSFNDPTQQIFPQ